MSSGHMVHVNQYPCYYLPCVCQWADGTRAAGVTGDGKGKACRECETIESVNNNTNV